MCFFSVSEGSRRRGGCRPPKRAGRARTRPTASDSWSPRGRSPPQASCPSSRRRCPPAAPGRTAPRGTAGRTCGAHTARTTSATQTTSSPDSGRGAGCWTGKAVRAALSSQRTSGAWARPHGHRRASRGLQRGGAARQGCRDFGRPAPRAQLPGLRVTSEDRADRRGDFAGHWAAADAPGLVGPSWWPPTRPQTQLRKLHPQEGGGLQPKTPACLHAQAPASPVPAHRSLLPRGRVCSRHLPSHT